MFRRIKNQLVESGMDGGEAKAVTLLLMEKLMGWSVAEALMATGGEEQTRDGKAQELMAAVARVAKGEPVQYVLGEAEFCGLKLHVEPGVLIPRSETEELVEWVADEIRKTTHQEEPTNEGRRMLDIGTGSGCIAIALAKLFPKAEVEAWDVSEAALRIAKENGKRNGVEVKWRKKDVLEEASKAPHNRTRRVRRAAPDGYDVPHPTGTVSGCRADDSTASPFIESEEKYSVVVSNPPYICESEADEMERNVLEHEPRVALFVPDNDPLLFYRKIAELAHELLEDDGLLFFEINRRFGPSVVAMLSAMGYRDVELRQDMYGNDRMVKAIKSIKNRY